MSARTYFNVTIEDKFTRYALDDLTLHLYVYPITINDDFTITGSRATDSSGNPISATDEGDGQYFFEDVEQGDYIVVAYKPGIRPQIVNGYSKVMVLPLLAGDEIAGSATDTTTLKTKINSVINYILLNNSGWTGTPPTPIA
jgi:hypothetical protein